MIIISPSPFGRRRLRSRFHVVSIDPQKLRKTDDKIKRTAFNSPAATSTSSYNKNSILLSFVFLSAHRSVYNDLNSVSGVLNTRALNYSQKLWTPSSFLLVLFYYFRRIPVVCAIIFNTHTHIII